MNRITVIVAVVWFNVIAQNAHAETGQAARDSAEHANVSGRLHGLFEGYRSYPTLTIGNTMREVIENVFYDFSPDGLVYRGVPKGGLEYFDFNRMRSTDPAHFGTYRVAGPAIEFAWDDGKKESASFLQRSDTRIVIRGVELDVIGAADGLRLDGTYAATSSHDFVKTGTATPGGLTQQHSIQFATDGRFGTGGSVTWGSPQAGRGGAYTRDGGVGTYRINGNTLELTLGGNRQALTFFVHPDHVKEQRPELIVLDGVVFQLEK